MRNLTPTRLLTPTETTAAKEREQRRAKEIPTGSLTPEMSKRGIRTYGQAEDAGLTPMSAGEQATTRARATEAEQRASKELEGYRKVGDEARSKRSQLELLETIYRKVGPTGAIVGPLREGVLNALQVFGVDSKTLAGIQTMDSASVQLMRATLKDFSGNDSDRDVMTAMRGSPSVLRTPAANQAILALATSQARLQELRAANANKWTSQFGSLAAKDPDTGLTFAEAWGDHTKSTSPIITPAMKKAMGLK